MFRYVLLALTLIAASLSTTYAAPVTMQFTATGFLVSNGNPAPTDPVTGTIMWDAVSPNSTINSLISINLTLDGHSYTLGEIGFLSQGNFDAIGGTLNTVSGIGNLTDDFWIRWDRTTLTPFDFIYASSQRSGIWDVTMYPSNPAANHGEFSSFSITQGSVPEPATLPLMILGAVGLWGLRKMSYRRQA